MCQRASQASFNPEEGCGESNSSLARHRDAELLRDQGSWAEQAIGFMKLTQASGSHIGLLLPLSPPSPSLGSRRPYEVPWLSDAKLPDRSKNWQWRRGHRLLCSTLGHPASESLKPQFQQKRESGGTLLPHFGQVRPDNASC